MVEHRQTQGDKTVMKNTAPIGLGICVVAGLFGLVGGVMSYVAWDFSFIGAAFLAAIIALIVAVVLWLGWRPANDNSRDMHAEAHRAGEAPTVPAAGYNAAATTAAAPAAAIPEPAPAPAPEPEPAPEPAPAPAPEPVPAAADGGKPEIKSSLLPGETELSERKGDWKYESDSAPAAASSSGDKDYDGDGVVEGSAEGSKPATLSAARDGGPDNLKEIKGVGPKMETMLHGMGFYHFDQIAAWTSDEVAWVDANLEGFKGRVSRDNWVEQAKVLASGGETEFSKRVEDGDVY